ncbi:MAG: hypothetical protein ACOCQ4_00915 [bacterium]
MSIVLYSGLSAGNHIIYVDISSENIDLEETRASVMNLLDSVKEESFLLFVSNGMKPYVCETRSQVNKVFDDLNYGAGTSLPDAYDDLDTLNAILTKQGLFDQVNSESRGLKEPVDIHFFLEPEQANYYKQIKAITKKFLLVNRLTNKKGDLIEQCRVRVYIDCSDSKQENCQQYLNKFKRKYKTYEFETF